MDANNSFCEKPFYGHKTTYEGVEESSTLSTTTAVKRPIVVLTKSVNNHVIVRLKNDLEYRGRMIKCDNYMNVVLDEAVEYNGGQPKVNYGSIFIRGNNIHYICIDAERF